MAWHMQPHWWGIRVLRRSTEGATMAMAAEIPEQVTPEPVTAPRQYRVVAACDFSALGDRVVIEAMRLCAAYPGAELPGAGVHAVGNDEAQEIARVHVARIVDAVLALGQPIAVEKIAVYVVAGTPSERIVALSTALDADLIVLGTHSRHGLGRLLLGSVAEEVMRRAPCGVFVIRPRDFLDGEKVPEIQPPLRPDEHALLPFRQSVTYHYVDRMNQEAGRLMPSI
jgi:nucleotide-binding universal stress UspA family protein